MEIQILKEGKDFLVLQMDNQTLAELLKTELNKSADIELAAWKREHPEKPVIFEVKTSGKSVKKEVVDALSALEKELDKTLDEFKKAIK